MSETSAAANQVRVRLSPELQAKIKISAEAEGRSVNAEYVSRLERSFLDDGLRAQIAQQRSEIHRLTEQIEYSDGSTRRAAEQRQSEINSLRHEIAVVRRSIDENSSVTVGLTDEIRQWTERQHEVDDVTRYLAQDRKYLELQERIPERRKTIVAPPPEATSAMARNLRTVIDGRTAHLVRLALRLAGVSDTAPIEREIFSEHAIDRSEENL